MTTAGSQNSVFILLVDDREENLTALEAMLRREEVTFLLARSGSQALELLLEHDIALALIDVQMPGMNGFELAELMRGPQRTRRVPIIFLTADNPTLQRKFRGYEAGAVDFLQKPIESDILRSKVGVFFELYVQRQEVARQRDELRAAIEENSRLLADTQQSAAALRQADRRKDEFLATLAHELRNPLAPILNAVHILHQLQPGPEQASNLHNIIGRQVSHMVRMVDELLEVSRITQGKIKLQRQHTAIADIIQSAVETSQPLIESREHHLTVQVPESPLMVHADSVRLTQVIANLLNNAAKYTPPGGEINLLVEAAAGWVTIRIRDTGIGIPPDRLEAVFDLFTQLHQAGEHSEGGLGIGLTLVKSLVELHGGTIHVTSQGLGQGTEFAVRLELLPSVQSVPAPIEPIVAGASAVRRVLIVDDNHDAANCLCLLLKALGHEVTVAHDGYRGLALVEEFHPDVVLLDLGMPGLDGFETARKIRALPAGKNLILAALTGWGQDDVRSRTQEVGFEYHLLKPVEIRSLTEILSLSPRGSSVGTRTGCSP